MVFADRIRKAKSLCANRATPQIWHLSEFCYTNINILFSLEGARGPPILRWIHHCFEDKFLSSSEGKENLKRRVGVVTPLHMALTSQVIWLPEFWIAFLISFWNYKELLASFLRVSSKDIPKEELNALLGLNMGGFSWFLKLKFGWSHTLGCKYSRRVVRPLVFHHTLPRHSLRHSSGVGG